MQRRSVLWAISAYFMASGATWLAAMVWRQSDIAFAAQLAPHVVAAALIGLTLARVLDRRALAIGFAASASLLWIATQYIAFSIHGVPLRWQSIVDGSVLAHYATIAALAVPVAALCAMPRLRGRPDHPLLWLWISALLTLGMIVVPLAIVAKDRVMPAAGVILIVLGPLVAGALTQVLKPYRAIWTTGGGALVFILMLIDQSARGLGPSDGVAGPLFGMIIFVLVGALGARLGWRLFRHKDPRQPAAAALPTASTHGDV